MIPLTDTESIYPVRIPEWPSLRWRPTIVVVLCIAAIRIVFLLQKRKKQLSPIPLQQEQPIPHFDLTTRLHELHEINTSIRTPEQKAKALLMHLLLYVGIDHHELSSASYTLAQLEQVPETAKILSPLRAIYEIIYTEKKITHSTINNIVKNIETTF